MVTDDRAWAKFAYQDDDLSTIVADLDEAQNRFNRDMRQYFNRVALMDDDRVPSGSPGSGQ